MPDSRFPLGVTAVMLPELDFEQQVSLMAELGLTHYSLRPRIISEKQRSQPWSNWGNHRFDLTPQRLLDEAGSLRDALTTAGLTPFGTVPAATTADSDETLDIHLQGALAVGAGRVRLNPAPYPKGAFDYGAYLDEVVKRYGQIIERSAAMGVKLVMETHAHSSAAGPGLAWAICRQFDPAHLGVIFDLPNFAREGNNQPSLAVSVLGPWIDHCHIGGSRRVSSGYDADGFRRTQDLFCPLGECDLYLPDYLAALSEADLECPLIIEDYTPGMPGATRLRDSAVMLRRALAAIEQPTESAPTA